MVKIYNFLILHCCITILICQSTIAFAHPAISLSVSVATIEATCGNNNGTIIVFVSNGTAPYQYTMDGTHFQISDTFSNIGPGNYMVAVKDANSNTGSTNASVSNLAGPHQVSGTPTAASCLNDDGGMTITGMGGNAPFTYSVNGTVYQNSGSFTGLASGNYTATIKDVNGCTATQPVVIPLDTNLEAGAGNDTTICEGSSASLEASSNGTSYSWSPSAGLSDPHAPDPKASPDLTTTYSLTVALGVCQKTASVVVTVNAAPLAGAGADTSICPGKSVQLTGSGGGGYAWSPGTYLDQAGIAHPNVDDPASTITYHLVVTDQQGCHSLNDAHTTVTIIPAPRVSAGNDTSVLVNQSFPLHAIDVDNSGFTQYAWSPSNGLNNPSLQDPIATLGESATYTVTASGSNGCAGTASVTIRVFSVSDLFVPTAFSPNGDGHNDILRVIAIGIKEFNYFAVYNRNGQRIFYTTDPGKGWDGTLNGVAQMTGAYVWMTGGVDFQGQRVDRKGTAILVR